MFIIRVCVCVCVCFIFFLIVHSDVFYYMWTTLFVSYLCGTEVQRQTCTVVELCVTFGLNGILVKVKKHAIQPVRDYQQV